MTAPDRKGQAVGGLRTVSEVAAALRVDVRTVYRWVAAGSLEVVRAPRRGRLRAGNIRIVWPIRWLEETGGSAPIRPPLVE